MITIDEEREIVTVEKSTGNTQYPLGSPEAFAELSRIWLRSGWDTKYVYSFSWLGRPIIQLPEDMFRIQEVIHRLKPDVVIETGIAHGGSLVFYASLLTAMGKGRVIGVDIEIRPHNRAAIESHPMSHMITLIEADSTDPEVLESLRTLLLPDQTVLVMLDSNHTKEHVLKELEAYAPLVSVGSYIVAADGIMADVVGAPRTKPDWSWNNPKAAALQFVNENNDFIIEEPQFIFNEGLITERVTYWPGAFIKKIQ